MTRYSSTMRDALMQIREGYSEVKEEKFAGWIAIYKGKKLEIKKSEAETIYGAKLKAIKDLKVPKSQVGLLAIAPAYEEFVKENPEDMQPASPDEGSMAVQQLEFMMHAIQKMKMHIQSGGEFPEWMQNKLSGTHEKLKSLYANIEHGDINEELNLDEMKMDDPKLVKAFDKMKKGDTIKLKTSSTISQGKDFVDYVVKSKNVVNKGRVEKITLATKGNEGAVKKFLYKRDGKVTFAIGDMGASIDDIKEGTWALPDSPKAKAELKKLMSKPIKLGKEGDEASDKLYALIGDDELFDDLYVAGKKNPNGDARDVVKKHMKRLGIKEEVELEEKLKVSDGLGAWIDDFKKSDAPQFAGKSDEEKKNMAIAAFTDAGGKLEQKEETELDEAPKMKYALVGTDMKIYSMGSDERDLRLDRRSLEQRFKDVAPLKMARLKTAQSIGDKVDKSQLKEEEEPNKPDTAKAVDQGREDKKKTRIAQLQLQIAKAQETINKLNAQEKPNG